MRGKAMGQSQAEASGFTASGVEHSSSGALEGFCRVHLPVLIEEGLDPVVMAVEGDPIGDGDGAVGHLEEPPEALGEGVEQRPGLAAASRWPAVPSPADRRNDPRRLLHHWTQ